MKGNGNNLSTFLRKIYFMVLPTSGQRSRYITKHKNLFHNVGEKLFFQPRKFPSDPELISFGNNVNIASGVSFINHDIIHSMLNKGGFYDSNLFKINRINDMQIGGGNLLKFKPLFGCISIGDNVMIGANSIILPNVKIGNNVIIAAGSIVSKDIPDNCVAGGVPAKAIGDFDNVVDKRRLVKSMTNGELWSEFEKQRK